MNQPLPAPAMPAAPEDVERPRTLLPDGAYALKVLRRQAAVAAVAFGVLAPMALVVGLQQKDGYQSYVAALYDNRDSAESIPRYPYYPRFAQIAEAFKTKLGETEFLWQVGRDVGLTRVRPAHDKVTDFLRKALPLGTKLFPQPAEHEMAEDSHTKAALARWLKTKITSTADDKKNILTLTATAEDPLTARRLAAEVMELFIQGELAFEAESLGRAHEVYSAWLADATRAETAVLQANAQRQGAEKDKQSSARSEADRLKERETEIVEKIQAVKSEIDAARGQATAQRAVLEADLARLATKLQPTHPSYIAKQDELRALPREGDDQALRSQLGNLRQALSQIRDEMRKLGLAVGTDEGRAPLASRGQFLPNLTDRVSELGLEQMRLSRQVDQPALRTRLRVFVPATYEESPASHPAKTTTIALLVLAAAAGLVSAVLRELRTPFARDAWRVAWRSQQRILGQISRSDLRVYPRLTPGLIASLDASAPAQPALSAYRELDVAITRRMTGNVLLVLSAGAGDRPGVFLHNFLNVTGTEAPRSLLVIDRSDRDPVIPAAEQPPIAGSFGEFLQGRVVWKDVRIPADQDRAFDLVPPGAGAGSPDAGKAYRPETLDKLFANLTKSYGRVVLRAHDARHVLANVALAHAVTDVVICADARSTKWSELERAISAVPPKSLRGLILIGT